MQVGGKVGDGGIFGWVENVAAAERAAEGDDVFDGGLDAEDVGAGNRAAADFGGDLRGSGGAGGVGGGDRLTRVPPADRCGA